MRRIAVYFGHDAVTKTCIQHAVYMKAHVNLLYILTYTHMYFRSISAITRNLQYCWEAPLDICWEAPLDFSTVGKHR